MLYGGGRLGQDATHLTQDWVRPSNHRLGKLASGAYAGKQTFEIKATGVPPLQMPENTRLNIYEWGIFFVEE